MRYEMTERIFSFSSYSSMWNWNVMWKREIFLPHIFHPSSLSHFVEMFFFHLLRSFVCVNLFSSRSLLVIFVNPFEWTNEWCMRGQNENLICNFSLSNNLQCESYRIIRHFLTFQLIHHDIYHNWKFFFFHLYWWLIFVIITWKESRISIDW